MEMEEEKECVFNGLKEMFSLHVSGGCYPMDGETFKEVLHQEIQ